MGISQLVLNCIGYKPKIKVGDLYPHKHSEIKSSGFRNLNNFAYFLVVCGDPIPAAYNSGNPELAKKLDNLEEELYR